jgi:hypothetical protein
MLSFFIQNVMKQIILYQIEFLKNTTINHQKNTFDPKVLPRSFSLAKIKERRAAPLKPSLQSTALL